MRLAHTIALTICMSLVGVPAAWGQHNAAETPHERALSLGHRGLRSFTLGNFAAAREDFETAERLAHSPVFLLYLARSERKLGRLFKARDLLHQCTREAIEPSTPEAWKRAVSDASRELLLVSAAIPTVRFVVRGGAVHPVRVQARNETFVISDEQPIREFDPGDWDLAAVDAHGNSISIQLFLREGEKERQAVFAFPVVHQLSQHPPRATAAEQARGRGKLTTVPHPNRSGAHTAFFLGGSAFLFSIAATTLAVHKARSVKSNCIGRSCRPEDQEVAQSAIRWANLATAGALVGTAGVATGLGLLLTPGGDSVAVSYRTRF